MVFPRFFLWGPTFWFIFLVFQECIQCVFIVSAVAKGYWNIVLNWYGSETRLHRGGRRARTPPCTRIQLNLIWNWKCPKNFCRPQSTFFTIRNRRIWPSGSVKFDFGKLKFLKPAPNWFKSQGFEFNLSQLPEIWIQIGAGTVIWNWMWSSFATWEIELNRSRRDLSKRVLAVAKRRPHGELGVCGSLGRSVTLRFECSAEVNSDATFQKFKWRDLLEISQNVYLSLQTDAYFVFQSFQPFLLLVQYCKLLLKTMALSCLKLSAILALHHVAKRSTRQIASAMTVHRSTVSRVLRTYNEAGERVVPKKVPIRNSATQRQIRARRIRARNITANDVASRQMYSPREMWLPGECRAAKGE